MTRLPVESWSAQGVDGPKYRVGPRCSVPGCANLADHAHHIWRRSFLGGDYAWVEFEGRVYGNLTGLCFAHHEAVTRGEAHILLDEGVFCWAHRLHVMPLDPQPPLDGLPLTAPGAGAQEPGQPVERCESCGHVKRPRVELPPGERRPKASWVVSVPKDERENGAEVLETLALEAAKILERDDHASWRYYTLAEALALFVQHGHLMAKEEA